MSLNPEIRATFEKLKAKIDEYEPIFAPELISTPQGTPIKSFKNGGKYQIINRVAYQFLEPYSKMTVEELAEKGFVVQSLVESIEAYQNERLLIEPGGFKYASFLGNSSTLDQLVSQYGKDNYVTDAIDRVLEKSSPLLGLDSNELKFITIEPSSKVVESMKELVISAVKDNKVKEVLGLSHTIAYVIENGFGIDQLATHTSNEVQKIINSLVPIQITINTEESEYEVEYGLIGTQVLTQGKNSLFTIKGEITGGEIFLSILQDYGTDKKINYSTIALRARNNRGNYFITGISEDQVSFPDGVFDANYQEGEDALNILRNDKSLVDKDIRTYEFQLYKELPSDGWMETVFDFFSGKPSTQELLKINFENKYAEFILSILQDFRDSQERLTESITNQRDKFFDNNFFRQIYALIAVDKELVRRVSVFNNLADAAEEAEDRGETLTDNQIRDIERG